MGEEQSNEDLKKYILETSYTLIEEYKEIVSKTFEITEKDLLQSQIENEDDKKESEQKLLEALKKRRTALDEVDSVLIKIESIEKRIQERSGEPSTDDNKDNKKGNWASRMGQRGQK